MSALQLQAFNTRMVQKLTKACQAHHNRVFSKRVIGATDLLLLGLNLRGIHGKKGTATPIAVNAIHHMHEQHQDRQSSYRSSTPSYDISWTCFPQKQHILLLYFCDIPEITEVWEQDPKVSPYPYWNNTDPPNDISARQWRARAAQWDKALHTSFPCSSGMTVSLFGKYYGPTTPSPQEIVGLQPSLKQRLDAIEKDILPTFAARYNPCKHMGIYEWVQTYRDWLKTPQGKAARCTLRAFARQRIPKRMGLKHIQAEYSFEPCPDLNRAPVQAVDLGKQLASLNDFEIRPIVQLWENHCKSAKLQPMLSSFLTQLKHLPSLKPLNCLPAGLKLPPPKFPNQDSVIREST